MVPLRRAVAYVRVSSGDESPENQRLAILEWARRSGVEVVGFFIDVEVGGGVPPRERPMYRAMIEFARANGIRTILFYDLSRLSRSLEDGLLELRRLVEEGFEFRFVAQEFLDYIEDPVLRKKVVSDFLWFAELYRRDVARRTAEALRRRALEGGVYHRPRLIHYVALWLSGKERFAQLAPEDVERARRFVRDLLGRYVEMGLPLTRIRELLLRHLEPLYERFGRAPRSREAVRRLLADAGLRPPGRGPG